MQDIDVGALVVTNLNILINGAIFLFANTGQEGPEITLQTDASKCVAR